jgi:Bacterial TSP3 repeat
MTMRRALLLACVLPACLAGPVSVATAARDRDHDKLPDRWERKYHISTKKKSARKDPDHDGLRNRREFRLKINPRRKDTDRDGLRDGAEVKRYHTNPRRKDTDGDGLSDGAEIKRYHTNPRRKDTDGDGIPDGVEVKRGTSPVIPGPAALPLPAPISGGSGAPPRLGCVAGSANATTAAQVRSAAAAGTNVCLTAAVGTVDLDGVNPPRRAVIGTAGAGSMGGVSLVGSSDIELRGRALSVDTRESARVTLESCTLGGTREQRTAENLVVVHERVVDFTVHNCDLGWTVARNTGNEGYGIRIFEGSGANATVARVTIANNLIHHIAADGIQGFGQARDVLIDRNEFVYVAPENGSDEHSDDIQVIEHGPNLRITNNFLHLNGYFDAGVQGNGESGPYIHGDDGSPNGTLQFENNLIVDERNFMQIGGLGTGGNTISNLTMRRNTIIHNGTAFGSSADPEYDIDGGSGNLVERNVFGSLLNQTPGAHTTFRDNVKGDQPLDAAGNCTTAVCNPAGQEPIGYRKPSGVRW